MNINKLLGNPEVPHFDEDEYLDDVDMEKILQTMNVKWTKVEDDDADTTV